MHEYQLRIDIPNGEYWDDRTETFHKLVAKTIYLEHSLYTISKWEKMWKKCLLKHFNKLSEKEFNSYIKCMIVEPENPTEEDVMFVLNNKLASTMLQKFLNDRMTATYIYEKPDPNRPNNEALTAELLYYYLIKLTIPIDIFEHWHINRLLTLISVFDMKDNTKKKRSVKEIMQDNNAINEARKAKLGTRG